MTSYPSITFKSFIRKVQKLGFQRIRQQGSHIRFVHPDGRKTTIPDHGNKDVPKGLLSKIIRYDLEMDQYDFWKQ
ncbi:type II toxin-antitoxin system HicA family toxin [Desulfobacula sp.]|uniref:type II toxin-antitoxin system HicA family toxin n=1 Tax=Desulfobacula sp. TaxID=2593537 RepID=UPI001D4AE483|nr:addiction module toxin, HicA family [Desulfobacula sp.]